MFDFTSINWWLVGAAGLVLIAWAAVKFGPALWAWIRPTPAPAPAITAGLSDYVAARETLRSIVSRDTDVLIWDAIGKLPAARKDGAA